MTGNLTITSGLLTLGDANEYGGIVLKAGDTGKHGNIYPSTLTANRGYALPDKDGTIAMTNDALAYVKIGALQVSSEMVGEYYDLSLNDSIDNYKWIMIGLSYYPNTLSPDYGHVMVIPVMLRQYSFEAISFWTLKGIAQVRYKNDTKLSVHSDTGMVGSYFNVVGLK